MLLVHRSLSDVRACRISGFELASSCADTIGTRDSWCDTLTALLVREIACDKGSYVSHVGEMLPSTLDSSSKWFRILSYIFAKGE
jgi:hypothetical protein